MKMECMMSGTTVDIKADRDTDNAILITQDGKIIGVISKAAQENIKTIRMTFTRDKPTGWFKPLQGQGIEVFRDTHESER